jgi:hypothetical protein
MNIGAASEINVDADQVRGVLAASRRSSGPRGSRPRPARSWRRLHWRSTSPSSKPREARTADGACLSRLESSRKGTRPHGLNGGRERPLPPPRQRRLLRGCSAISWAVEFFHPQDLVNETTQTVGFSMPFEDFLASPVVRKPSTRTASTATAPAAATARQGGIGLRQTSPTGDERPNGRGPTPADGPKSESARCRSGPSPRRPTSTTDRNRTAGLRAAAHPERPAGQRGSVIANGRGLAGDGTRSAPHESHVGDR